MSRQWKKQASVAYGYALTRLVLNSYIYFEELPENYEEKEAVRRQKPFDQKFQKLLQELVDDTLCLDAAAALRSEIQKEMECIIAFTDCFRIYEYVLNRIERKFDEMPSDSGLSDSEAANEIMGFVFESGDAAVMNRRIQEIIGQLPIRFTRQKYYSMVHEALSAYIGAQGEALEDVMYLLRTAGMAELREEQKKQYPDLAEYLEHLEQMTFRTMTAEEYQKAVQFVQLSGEMLNALSEYYQMLQEMVNDLYLIALTKGDAIRNAAHEQCAYRLLDALLKTEHGEIPEAAEQELYGLEGVQEEYYEKYLRMEPIPEFEEGEDEEISNMRKVELLMSSSSFMSLEKKASFHTVTREDIDAAFEAFVQQVEPVLKHSQKPVVRAVMAMTLSTLPICFYSAEEFRAYVENSLGGCSDIAEKEASMELIHQLMEMEDYAVS